MTLDNHLADGEPQTHSVWFRRNESIENGFSILRTDTWPPVFDGDCNLVVGFPLCPHNQCPRTNYRIHCINRIVDQIADDLLQLTFVTENGW